MEDFMRFVCLVIFGLAACCWTCAAQIPDPQSPPATELVHLARQKSPLLEQTIQTSFPARAVELGKVWVGQQHDFFFTVRTHSKPQLVIDDGPELAMDSIPGTDLWYAAPMIEHLGTLHSFHYVIDGKPFGGNVNVPAFGELSYRLPGVKAGILSPKLTVTSKLYDEMTTEYRVYVPDGYDAKVPTATMIFLDGNLVLGRDGGSRTLEVLDNLIHLKRIPYMIAIFVNPGKIDISKSNPTSVSVKRFADRWGRTTDDALRSVLCDTVSDRYPHFLADELLPAVGAQYNVRKDAYSHAIAGFSSGGNCSFNAAWQLPQEFSRVLSGIGSYTSIQWAESPDLEEGAQDYPDKVLREEHRNIRVWLQDGSDDLEQARFGSWPLGNIRLANALKLRDYDFHFSFGTGGHGPEQVEAQLPEVLTWLWRDYDAGKREQAFQMETSEKAKPVFRVMISNRDAN
jgi:enterochelin esterase family protein